MFPFVLVLLGNFILFFNSSSKNHFEWINVNFFLIMRIMNQQQHVGRIELCVYVTSLMNFVKIKTAFMLNIWMILFCFVFVFFFFGCELNLNEWNSILFTLQLKDECQRSFKNESEKEYRNSSLSTMTWPVCAIFFHWYHW